MRVVSLFVAVMCIGGWAGGALAAEKPKTTWLDQVEPGHRSGVWTSPRRNRSCAGGPLRVGGKTYARGLGTHAPSRFALSIGGRARRLIARVGVDDEVGPNGSVEFQVVGDGKVLWSSGRMTGSDVAKELDVDLAKVRELELVATDAGDGQVGDHADWLEAKLEVTGGRPRARGVFAETAFDFLPLFYVRKDTWQKTMRVSFEALADVEATERRHRDERRRSDPALKGFSVRRVDLTPGGAPRAVKFRVAGMEQVVLRAEMPKEGKNRRATVFLGEARLLEADGKETVIRPDHRLMPGRYGTGWVGEERKPVTVGGREFPNALILRCERNRGVEAVLNLRGRYEWLEAHVYMPAKQNRPDEPARLTIDCQSAYAVEAAAIEAGKRLRSRVAEDFRGGHASRQLVLENGDHIWDGHVLAGGVGAIAQRYARACKAEHRKVAGRLAKVAKTPAELAAVRGLYYLRHAEDRLDLARKTLAFVQAERSQPKLAAALDTLARRVEQFDANHPAGGMTLYTDACRLRRRIILAHPLLDFEKLLITKRPPPVYSHMCDQYLGRHSRPGPGLVVLENWKSNPTEAVLLDGKLPVGSVLHPDLSYDGRRVVFSYCDHTPTDRKLRRFFLWEIGVDGKGLRQITGTASDPLQGWGGRHTVIIEDFDPAYLPDGGIVFISTRNQTYGRCHGGRYTPAYMLFRAEADGSDLHQISFGEANEWDPAVLGDGRIVYSRWDYINRHDTIFQSLWTTYPDGRATAHYYGNYSRAPCMIAEPRPVPGSHKVVATATAHHGYTTGSTILVDPEIGQDGLEPLTRVTGEFRFPEAPDHGRFISGAAATPWALSEDLHLVAYMTERRVGQGGVQSVNAYSIYLVDSLGGRELIYADANMSCFSPIPIVPRPAPPVLPTIPKDQRDEPTGVFFVRDVYESTQPIPPGSVKAIRVNAIFGQPTNSHPQRSRAANEIVKKILGTVPVEADGSVAFRAPAGKPMQLQALDANGMAILTMRSLVYLQPGERAGCVGCHEPRHENARLAVVREQRPIRDIRPPAGPRYPQGFSFARTVQPVLDRYCIRCHGLDPKKIAGKIDLLGTPAGGFSTAYCSLTDRRDLVKIAHRNAETAYSKPGDYFARAGKLAAFLMGKHRRKSGIDADGLRRIIDWLDVNAQFYGDYSRNRDEDRRVSDKAVKALRAKVLQRFGPEWARQPLAALVNVALPAESRILKAPLATKAGGWGQVAAGGWAEANDPDHRAMRTLVEATIVSHESRDIEGCCGRKHCRCGACWVRRAEKEYRESLVAPKKVSSRVEAAR